MTYYSKYLKYKAKYIELKQKQEMKRVQAGGGKIDVMLFKAEWCGHCKNFKPTWNKLEELYGKKYNFITYDADKNEKEIAQWEIRGFPTLMIKNGKEAVEYRGSRDIDSLINFFKELN